ncbi:hypothetical protein BJ508DRAFT_111327 [Ascobolus immersus RN42]|uniref:Uncharacterized protein n=1 Tax=Ascobolus immersus RN42 TaxID=1160509 RepID=A0A3N4IBS6_ASCIM|nr:hypothetical protein BJ508DRAFT_111327 [Ascobolus immersus RN42]
MKKRGRSAGLTIDATPNKSKHVDGPLDPCHCSENHIGQSLKLHTRASFALSTREDAEDRSNDSDPSGKLFHTIPSSNAFHGPRLQLFPESCISSLFPYNARAVHQERSQYNASHDVGRNSWSYGGQFKRHQFEEQALARLQIISSASISSRAQILGKYEISETRDPTRWSYFAT